jgi:hypothetical protein
MTLVTVIKNTRTSIINRVGVDSKSHLSYLVIDQHQGARRALSPLHAPLPHHFPFRPSPLRLSPLHRPPRGHSDISVDIFGLLRDSNIVIIGGRHFPTFRLNPS